eukprot:CAMPEP_0196707664 /NCGR_PEP_ID=MMETSP1090-20130531/64520_1 /TAXON_ID=37098 /ORGANISM="Isochrysis sp, Strain CCMP1244" /LENGTH=120 /DNA_ID=CAMNT_0042047645 /DNA_START=173 /DNA_END=534 /DNA_ORIENTATION=-
MATAAESSPCKFRSLTTSLSSIASFTLWSDARTFSACADNTFISAAHNSASAVVAASSTVSSARYSRILEPKVRQESEALPLEGVINIVVWVGHIIIAARTGEAGERRAAHRWRCRREMP